MEKRYQLQYLRGRIGTMEVWINTNQTSDSLEALKMVTVEGYRIVDNHNNGIEVYRG